jgi:hypothetical protein
MIVFDLKCTDGHVFEAWFRDGDTYEAQAAANEIVCPICGGSKIDKAPMAPNLARRSSDRDAELTAKTMSRLRAMRNHVEKTCDDVGAHFPEEARKIHYGEAEKRGIYGEASLDEARDLHEEGIEFGILPPLPRHDS